MLACISRCALECLGSIYEYQGRMAGSAFPETVQVLLKLWKVQEYRSDIMEVLTRLLKGLGPSSSSAHKDIYKCVKSGLGDKSMAVRSASAKVRGGGGGREGGRGEGWGLGEERKEGRGRGGRRGEEEKGDTKEGCRVKDGDKF